MPQSKNPRVAICGMMLESNSFAPVTTEADFRERGYFLGEDIMTEARAKASVIAREVPAFVAAMDATGPWQPVPLLFTASQPAGPCDHAFFEDCMTGIENRLRDAGDVDAVFVANHGAMTTTGTPDPDGEMIARIRALVGPDTPIVVTHDLHANVSELLVESATLLIGYLTNPHVDMPQRAEEAAFSLRTILGETENRFHPPATDPSQRHAAQCSRPLCGYDHLRATAPAGDGWRNPERHAARRIRLFGHTEERCRDCRNRQKPSGTCTKAGAGNCRTGMG